MRYSKTESIMNDLTNYDVEKFPWYSPQLVIKAVRMLTQTYGETNFYKRTQFQRAREMFEAAVAILGMYATDPVNKYFLQPNLQKNKPDVATATQIETPNQPITLGLSNLELTSLTEYTKSDDVVKFLQETKFHKDYASDTIILLVVKRKISLDRDKVVKEFRAIKPKWTIYIVGKLQDSEKWVIFSPWPTPTKPVIYDLAENSKLLQLPSSVTFQKKLVQKISYVDSQKVSTMAHEVCGIDEKKIEKYKMTKVF